LFCRRGPVNATARLLNRVLQLLEILIQVRERVFLDSLGVVAEPIAVAEGGVAAAIAGHERAREPDEGRLQWNVGQRLSGGVQEVVVFVTSVAAHDVLLWLARPWCRRPEEFTWMPGVPPGAGSGPCSPAGGGSRRCS